MKKLILMMLMASGFYGNSLYADWGLFEADRSWIHFNSGTYSVWNNGSGTIQNTDLGTFINAEVLTLAGYDVKTYKNGDSDVTGGMFYFVIYSKNNRPVSPIFQSQALGWIENIGEGGDQKWGFFGQNINLLSGLTSGEYTIEFYVQVNGTNPNESKYDNNNTINNYTAHFRYNYVRSIANGNWDETSTWINSKIPGDSHIAEISHNITASGDISGTSVIIKSNSSSTGSLIHNTAGVQATVERYISGAAESWHLISSPVAGQTISGDWTPSGSYGDGTGYDFYAWHEPSETWLNQKVGANNITSFIPGKGYLVAYQTATPTKIFSGTLNAGETTFPVTVSGASTFGHANLAGNPYPSSIDWKENAGFTRSVLKDDDLGEGVGYSIYIWNESSNNYGAYISNSAGDNGTNGTSRYIAPMQGFFVTATSAGDLIIKNDARAHSTQSWLKSGTDNSFRLKVVAPENYGSDELLLEFGQTTSFGGAEKWNSFVANASGIYTPKNGKNYSISYLSNVAENQQIPVSVAPGIEGNYSLTADYSNTAFSEVTLFDLKTNTSQNLNINPVYTFSATPNDDPNRFLLHFGLVSVDEQLPTETLQAYAYNNRLYVNSSLEKASLSVYDLQGRLLLQRQINESGLQSVEMKMPAGVYIIRLQNTKQSKSVKIVVQ